MIDNMIKRRIKKENQQKSQQVDEIKDDIKYMCIPYNSYMEKSVRKTFSNSNIKVSYKTKNNIFKIINNKVKDYQDETNDIYNKSGIYKISCSDCNCYYIGQTSRNFKIRFKEHLQALKSMNKTTMKSNFADHLINSGHEYKNIEENLTILAYERDHDKLLVKEEMNIYMHYKKDPLNILNSMQIKESHPIYDKINKLRFYKK